MSIKEKPRRKILWVFDAINGTRQIQEYGQICVVEIDFLELTHNDPDSPSLKDIKNILCTQLEKRLGVVEIVEKYTDDWDSATHFLLEVDREKFGREHTWFKSESTHECGQLRVNLDAGTIQYGNKEPVTVSPKEMRVAFLALLIEGDGQIVEYVKIAKDLGMNCWNEGVKEGDKDVHRSVHQLKKDVRKFLIKRVKVPASKVDIMITAERNAGFKINC